MASLTLAFVGALVWLVVVAMPALGHEFAVGILVGPDPGGGVESAFMDGFRLAVDESPDVSHAPGPAAGDHLGGLDVGVFIVEAVGDPDDVTAAALDLIQSEGVAIIVADLATPILEAVAGPVTESGTFVISVSCANEAELPDTPLMFAVGGGDMLVGERFQRAFLDAYGRPPSAAANRGYLAGQTIDEAVATTGGDFTDGQAFNDALRSAIGLPAPASGTAAIDGTAQPDDSAQGQNAGAEDTQQPSTRPTWIVVAGVVVLAAAAVRWRTLRNQGR